MQSTPKFFRRYFRNFDIFRKIEGSWVIYWADSGCASSCRWMIPGTWNGED